jgi:hypothetical protein
MVMDAICQGCEKKADDGINNDIYEILEETLFDIRKEK